MKSFLLLLLTVPCVASGPKYVGSKTDPQVYQEFGNVYQDLRNPNINTTTISTGTVKFISISTMTVSSSTVTNLTVTNINGSAYTAVTGGQLPATTTNDNAAAGKQGEYVESVVSNVNAGTSGFFADLTSISLTAGDWDVTGTVHYEGNGGTWSNVQSGISATSGNSSAGTVLGSSRFNPSWGNTSTVILTTDSYIPSFRVSISATTTYYLKYLITYTAGLPQASGRISARRPR